MSLIRDSNHRLAINTIFLYFRMLFTMLISLYTSRVVLKTLGVDDYGIYNVVGGIVSLFSIISAALSGSIARFITFELGFNNSAKLNIIFSTSINIQIIFAFIIILLSEIGGIWFISNEMSISVDKVYTAIWVLQCSIFTFAINIISVPYNAALIAHENMKVFAYISIIETILKLLIVYVLYISTYNKLITYSLLLLGVSVFIRLLYGIYCKKRYEECQYHFIFDKKVFKEMASFAGWNFIGASSFILRDQGVNIVINIFFGPAVNAARAISTQVSNAVLNLGNSFMSALNPQITKSYANSDFEYTSNLIIYGAKISFFLLFIISLPIIIETEAILQMWLSIVPKYGCIFVKLMLFFSLCESIASPMTTALLATGKIKYFQIIVGGLQILNFPLSYLLLHKGMQPETTIIIAIAISHLCLVTRLIMINKEINLSIRCFIFKTYIPIVLVVTFSFLFPLGMQYLLKNDNYRVIITIISCFISTIFWVYVLGCSKHEKLIVKDKIKKVLCIMGGEK